MPRLENWSLVSLFNPYKAPEARVGLLKGVVYDHEKFDDGTLITTSMLVDLNIDGASAKTFSGSNYTLGRPDPEWMKFLEEVGSEYIESLNKLTPKFVN